MKKILHTLLARAARFYVARTKPYIIGITGSVGKTTCRMIITQMLRQQLPTIRIDTSEKNFNSEIGLCLAILGINTYTPTKRSTLGTVIHALTNALFAPQRAEVFVLEYGIDHPGDMKQLLGIAMPHISVLTGVDLVHAAYFPDGDAIFDEKVQLLFQTKEVAFWSSSLDQRMKDVQLSCDGLSFALHEDENETDIGFNAYQLWRQDEQIGSSFVICEGEERMTTVRTNLLGHEHAGYVSLAYEISQIIAHRLDISVQERSRETIELDIPLQSGRASRLRGKRGSLLMDSSYNASPQSMAMMITMITQIRQQLFPERRLVLCLGEMRELGSYTQEMHESLAQQVIRADMLYLIGESVRLYTMPLLQDLGYAQDRVQYFSNSQELGQALDKRLGAQQHLALVLFKGSQNTIFLEEAVKEVLRYPDDKKLLCRQEEWWMKKKFM